MNTPGPLHQFAPFAPTLLRVSLGVVFLAHALFKALVLSLPGSVEFFSYVGFPGWAAYAVIATELVAGIALVSGVYVAAASLSLVPIAVGAVMVHWRNGWNFTGEGGGWEYPALLVVLLIVQAGLGSGRLAIRTRYPLYTSGATDD